MTTQIHPVDHELVQAAADVARTRCQGDNHTMAAAARARDGRIVTAVNAYHFAGGPCAEMVVIGAAAAQGAYELDTIVAVGDRDRESVRPVPSGPPRLLPCPSRSSSAKTTASEPSSSPTCSPKATSGPTTSSTPSSRASPPRSAEPLHARPGRVAQPVRWETLRGFSADAAIQMGAVDVLIRELQPGDTPRSTASRAEGILAAERVPSVRGDVSDRAAPPLRLRLSLSCR